MRQRRERGASAVEFAIILPLMLLMIGGITDFGRAYYTQITLTNATREGARAAVVGVDATGVQARTRAAMPSSLSMITSVPPVACGAAGSNVTVTATASFEWLILGPMLSFVGGGSALPANLSSSATMRCGG